MRLFTAIDLPEEVMAALDRLVGRLRPTARLGWSPAGNFHITTKFLGEWPAERLNEVEAALSGLPARAPIPIEVRGLGFFPNERSPRVFWAGIEAPPDLGRLARETEDALAALGIPKEKRPFSPHLTLARNRNAVTVHDLLAAIAKLPSQEFGRLNADRFYLYQSQLRPGGSVYTRIAEFPFERS